MRAVVAALVLVAALVGPTQANSTIGHTIRASCVNSPDHVLAGESFVSTATGLKPGTYLIYVFNYDTQTSYGPIAEVTVSGSKTASVTLSTKVLGQQSIRWTQTAGVGCVVTVTSPG